MPPFKKKTVIRLKYNFFFYIYFCGMWAFSSSRKYLVITLLRLEFVALFLYFSIYFYLCSFNYSLFFVVYFFLPRLCSALA